MEHRQLAAWAIFSPSRPAEDRAGFGRMGHDGISEVDSGSLRMSTVRDRAMAEKL